MARNSTHTGLATFTVFALATACNHTARSEPPSHHEAPAVSEDAASPIKASRESHPPQGASDHRAIPEDADLPADLQPRAEDEICGVAERHPRGAPAAAPEHMQPPTFEVRASAGTLVRCHEAVSLVEDFIATIRETMEIRGWTCAWGEPGAEPAARCTSPDGELTFDPNAGERPRRR